MEFINKKDEVLKATPSEAINVALKSAREYAQLRQNIREYADAARRLVAESLSEVIEDAQELVEEGRKALDMPETTEPIRSPLIFLGKNEDGNNTYMFVENMQAPTIETSENYKFVSCVAVPMPAGDYSTLPTEQKERLTQFGRDLRGGFVCYGYSTATEELSDPLQNYHAYCFDTIDDVKARREGSEIELECLFDSVETMHKALRNPQLNPDAARAYPVIVTGDRVTTAL